MAANVNDPYSENVVTEAQRGRQLIGGANGNAFDAWTAVPDVANAHDQQAAPTHLFEAALDNDATHLAPAPVADHDTPANVSRDSNTTTVIIYPAGGTVQST